MTMMLPSPLHCRRFWATSLPTPLTSASIATGDAGVHAWCLHPIASFPHSSPRCAGAPAAEPALR